MKYYYLQIKEGYKPFFDCVDKWLDKNHFAAIFSLNSIDEFLSDKKGLSKDSKNFVKTFYENKEESILVSIGSKEENNKKSDYLYIYKKSGKISEYKGLSAKYKVDISHYKTKPDIVIGFPITLIAEIPVVKAPLVISTIKSNQYLSRGTFKELWKRPIKDDPESTFNSYFGNRKAIDYLITGKSVQVDNFEQYLECLSSIEFETLIAKIKEEQGYFVPAYKGGSFKDYDILCFKKNKEEYIQAKLNLSKDTFKDYKDIKDLNIYCVHSEVDKQKYQNIFNYEDIQKQLESCPKTKEWLKRSLNWVSIKRSK